MLELLLVAMGVVLRLRQYLADRSLWLDEAMLANVLLSHPLHDLVLAPLPDNQAAPPATLALMRAGVVLLGTTERALRVLPMLAGVVALVAAWRLAARLYSSRAARCCLIGLVALSPTLVYYSAEVKQYALDAAACLVLLHLGLRVDGGGRMRLGLAGTIAPWLSHPALFLLPGAGAVQAVRAGRREGAHAIAPLLVIAGAWAASVGALVMLTQRSVTSNQVLEALWQGGFAPFPIRSAADVGWYGGLYDGLVSMAFQMAGAEGPAPNLWWPAWLDLALPFVLLGGVAALACRPVGRSALAIIGVTILAALAASAAHQYPLAHRLLVFAVPLVFVLLASAVEGLALLRGPGPLLAAGLAAALVAISIPPAVAVAMRPFSGADMKGALAYVAAHARAGDQLAPTGWSEPALRFYRSRYELDGLIRAPIIPPAMDAPAYVATLRARDMLARTWVVIAHRFVERDGFLVPARSLAPQLDAWEGNGAGVYLFDFGAARR